MRAEILTIGDELLIGQIVNTNSVWIAQQLNLVGIKVVHMTTVADEENAMTQSFNDAGKRADFVFITGGLGPTKDDVTKKVFAKYFNKNLVVHEGTLKEIVDYFTKRGRPLNDMNRNQALVAEDSIVFRNAHGTAPGMWLAKNKTVYISMPGVPYEMMAMMSDYILPKILSENKLPKIFHKTVLTQGIGETAIAEIIEKWENQLSSKNIKLAYLPQPGLVKLRLSSYGENFNTLKNSINQEIEILQTLIGKFIFGFETYGEQTPTIAKIVSELLRERKKTISLAESCTGGYVSSLFTELSGASEIFKGAVVPYTNIAKQQILEVEAHLFETVGAVSKECVEQLALSVRKKFDSDYSIAISGIAGPSGGTREKPVGTIWVAVSSADKTVVQKYQFGDNRQRNIVSTASSAINLLRKLILEEDKININN